MINDFRKQYFFLSNFYERPVTYDGITYKNTEAAFQAQKTTDNIIRQQFAELDASAAKTKGQKVILRSDWETVKLQAMYEVCLAKFTQNEDLAKRLIATGDEYLEEGNNWGDTTWGTVNGTGKNYLGKVLMRIRSELQADNIYTFDADKVKDDIIEWIKEYFISNAGPATHAVIGISGGKDSSVCAKLLVEALGKERVIGVLMPQGIQNDIDVSRRVIDILGIKSYEINIGDTMSKFYQELLKNFELTNQVLFNSPARIRMAVLYAVAACVGGRVVNTCNLSEDYVGYSTKGGDSIGDFSPLSDLTATEVVAVGDALGLPYDITHKTPIDGLCGKTDEESFGFSYAILDRYLREGDSALEYRPDLKEKIELMHKKSLHKLLPMPKYTYNV